MDINSLVQILASTLDGTKHDAAEAELKKVHKIIGFNPQLLQIAMNQETPAPVRLAAVVYFKNEIINSWNESSSEGHIAGPEPVYTIHEQDKGLVRNLIIDVIASVPENIQLTLAVALKTIVKYDFPEKWHDIVDKISVLVQTNQPQQIGAALVSFHCLVKPFEYRNLEGKGPLVEAMKLLNPLLYQLFLRLLADPSEQSIKFQKSILKSIFRLIMHTGPSAFYSNEEFTKWLEVVVQVLERPLPDSVAGIDPDDRKDNCHFKNKKWALHIVVKVFERYGTPKTCQKAHKGFAKWFLNTFAVGLLNVVMAVLEQHSQTNIYTPRIVQECINYLNNAVEYMSTWKVMKVKIPFIIEKIIFPLMCFTDEDEELWSTDPQEYCRRKFDYFEEILSPLAAAQSFLNLICKIRKEMLSNTVAFSIQILNAPNSTAREKDGALQMLGVIADLLFKKEKYRGQMNNMLVNIVFPFFASEYPFLRARAAFVLKYFESFDFQKDEQVIYQAAEHLKNALLNESELPVKLQAAITLKGFLSEFEKIRMHFEPLLQTIMIQYLELIRNLYNDEVVNALQHLINLYGEKVIPISGQIVEHLVHTFLKILESPDDCEEHSYSSMGILDTLDSVLVYNSEQVEVMKKLEPVALQAVSAVLSHKMEDLYSETFGIVSTLTTKYISPECWQIYEFSYGLVKEDETREVFTEIVSCLHNYLIVDPEAFISNEKRVSAFFDMCAWCLEPGVGEMTTLYALKLMEVFVSQHKIMGAKYLPKVVELTLATMVNRTNNPEPFARRLIVLIAVYYETSPDFLFQCFAQLSALTPGVDLKNWFFEQWFTSMELFTGIHDRKLSLLAFTKVLQSIRTHAPTYVINNMSTIFPNVIRMFEKLKGAYKSRARYENGSDTDDEGSEDGGNGTDDEHELDDDEDEGVMGDEVLNQQLNGMLEDELNSDSDDDSDDEYDDDFDDDGEFESYETLLDGEDAEDEYVAFRHTLEHLQAVDAEVYSMLTASLNKEQVGTVEEVYTFAKQRQEAKESKKIEQAGGYSFANQAVPKTFNFGGQ